MIHVTQGTTQIKGTKLDLAVEFTALVHHFVEEHVFTKEEMQEFIDLGSKTDDELKAENEKLTNELKQKVEDLGMPDELKDMLKLFGNLL